MKEEIVLNNLHVGSAFDKQQFKFIVRMINPEYSDSSINWLLEKLRSENQIASIGRGRYIRIPACSAKTLYTYEHSNEYLEVEGKITERYPMLEFQMWELIQFNEFLKHQIAKNLIVVEVENMLEDGVFDTLREQYPNVFISPKIEQYHRYKGKEDNIVVLKLISEAPKPKDGHSSTLEKLLVDLFSNKFTGRLIEHSEYPAIFEDVFNKYYLDEAKMFRYARRRNVESKIKGFMKENTITTEN